jgi:hypothetical protein
MPICDPNSITKIRNTECIGNSLTTINDNFDTLKAAACDNYSTISNLLSGISLLNDRFNSFANLVPGIAKAWVKFNGSKPGPQGGNRDIYSSYNVNSVEKDIGEYSRGQYIIRVKQGIFLNKNIAVLGTSSESIGTGGGYTWVQPTEIDVSNVNPAERESVIKICVHSTTVTDVADPTHISVVMFSL